MDPLADKLLVCSALICLMDVGKLPSWAVIVIISREFIISGFRLVASDNGIVIAASWWGKSKTISQMVMIILMIADFGGVFGTLETILLYAERQELIGRNSSMIDYIWKNRQVLSMQN